jgi:hypothetical protein
MKIQCLPLLASYFKMKTTQWAVVMKKIQRIMLALIELASIQELEKKRQEYNVINCILNMLFNM